MGYLVDCCWDNCSEALDLGKIKDAIIEKIISTRAPYTETIKLGYRTVYYKSSFLGIKSIDHIIGKEHYSEENLAKCVPTGVSSSIKYIKSAAPYNRDTSKSLDQDILWTISANQIYVDNLLHKIERMTSKITSEHDDILTDICSWATYLKDNFSVDKAMVRADCYTYNVDGPAVKYTKYGLKDLDNLEDRYALAYAINSALKKNGMEKKFRRHGNRFELMKEDSKKNLKDW